MSEEWAKDLTAALSSARAGDEQGAAALFPLVYAELRRLAGGYFRGSDSDHTLQPTALVHEAFLRLVRHHPESWQDRSHFVAVAATAMRQILIDHARRGLAQKRGGGAAEVTVNDDLLAGDQGGLAAIDVLALDAALQKLAALSPRQARLIELHYFGGLTVDEVAAVLEVSKSLVEKDWRRARAWLRKELAEGAAE